MEQNAGFYVLMLLRQMSSNDEQRHMVDKQAKNNMSESEYLEWCKAVHRLDIRKDVAQ